LLSSRISQKALSDWNGRRVSRPRLRNVPGAVRPQGRLHCSHGNARIQADERGGSRAPRSEMRDG
ncbi:hypothetical protein PMAYCL1PPCAC_01577, partial [Pristionchus mayeri]